MFTRNSAHLYNINQTLKTRSNFDNRLDEKQPIGTRKSMYDVEEKFLVNRSIFW